MVYIVLVRLQNLVFFLYTVLYSFCMLNSCNYSYLTEMSKYFSFSISTKTEGCSIVNLVLMLLVFTKGGFSQL